MPEGLSPAETSYQPQPFSNALEFAAALATVHLAVWLVVSSGCFAAGASLHGSDAILALPIALSVCAYVGRMQLSGSLRSSITFGSVALIIVWLLALIFAWAWDDLSYDGQTYHALGVLQLRQGWNPFQSLLAPDLSERLFVNHYPKAPWIWAAGIDAIVGGFQTAKATNLLLVIAAAAAAANAACAVFRAPASTSLLIGALAAANPVALAQLPTMYVDGQVASLFLVMAAGSLVWSARRSPLGLLTACSAAVCLTNVKFTAAVYAIALAVAVMAIAITHRRWGGTLPLLACVFGLVGPGYSPYVLNVLNGDHPLYPALGERRISLMSSETPTAFDGHSTFAQLALSLASETANSCRGCDAEQLGQPKLPFTIYFSKEVRGVALPDARTGGFGPLFSAALVLSAALLALAAWTRAVPLTMVTSLGVLIGTVVIIPAAWWARFVPQLWLVPVTISLLRPSDLTKVAKMLRLALLSVLVANSAFAATFATGQNLLRTQKARAQIARMARIGPLYARKKPDDPEMLDWVGAQQRLRDGGVIYSFSNFVSADCKEIVPVLYAALELCVPKSQAQ